MQRGSFIDCHVHLPLNSVVLHLYQVQVYLDRDNSPKRELAPLLGLRRLYYHIDLRRNLCLEGYIGHLPLQRKKGNRHLLQLPEDLHI